MDGKSCPIDASSSRASCARGQNVTASTAPSRKRKSGESGRWRRRRNTLQLVSRRRRERGGNVSLRMEANNWSRAVRDVVGDWRLSRSRHYSRNQVWKKQVTCKGGEGFCDQHPKRWAKDGVEDREACGRSAATAEWGGGEPDKSLIKK